MSRPPPLPVPSIAPTPGELARTQRRAGRSALLGLALLGVAAIASPLLGYREDVRRAHEEQLERLSDRARLRAEALATHLELLEAELLRLAERRELTPEDVPTAPAVHVLDAAFHHSPLFSEGVALLTPEGVRTWSDPGTMALGTSPLPSRPWFRQVLTTGRPAVHLLEGEGSPLVVAVPVTRGGAVKALLVGELRMGSRALPQAQSETDATVLLLDHEGQWLLPVTPAHFTASPDLTASLRSLEGAPGVLEEGRTRLLGAVSRVGTTGLLLAVVDEEERATARLRKRYLGQLAFHSALLGSTLLLFTLLLRHSYRSLLAAEERLRRQETMAALGTAASLIAHEVKNALNGIQAALSVLRPANPADETPVRTLRSQVQRLGHLARSLLSFGAPRAALRRSCELRLLVEEALQAVRLLPESEDVMLETSLEEGLVVHVDPALLVSAVDNLVRNAVEAGAVAKDTGLQPAPRVVVRLARAGGEAVLVVEDNAGGVDPKLEPRLWEPFATGRAKGVGLGLPMARTSVLAHGGSLAYTRLPDGSRFTLRLPLESDA